MSALETRLARIERLEKGRPIGDRSRDVDFLVATVRALVDGMRLMYQDQRDKVIADVERSAK